MLWPEAQDGRKCSLQSMTHRHHLQKRITDPETPLLDAAAIGQMLTNLGRGKTSSFLQNLTSLTTSSPLSGRKNSPPDKLICSKPVREERCIFALSKDFILHHFALFNFCVFSVHMCTMVMSMCAVCRIYGVCSVYVWHVWCVMCLICLVGMCIYVCWVYVCGICMCMCIGFVWCMICCVYLNVCV